MPSKTYGPPDVVRAVLDHPHIEGYLDGDTFPRFKLWTSGKIEMGNGSSAPSTVLSASGSTGGFDRLIKVKKVALANVDTAGGVFAFSPGVACFVERVVVNRTTASSGACTIDIGIAANATTLNDTLMDGLNANATAGISDNINDAGTNGKARQLMSATQYVTASVASGASAGLVGFAYIHYVEL